MTRPLEGIRILDLSIALTGPYAVALLADQGAEVIKVERPGIGDIARWVGVMVNGMSALYLMCNRGKRCDRGRCPHRGRGGDRQGSGRPCGRRDPEFPTGRHGPPGPRLRGHPRGQPRRGLRIPLRVRIRGSLPRSQRVRHGDPGLRRAGHEPGRSRRRRPGVPAPDGGRQGHRPVRLAGHHRGLARPGHGKGRAARRAGHDGCRGILPVGRLRRQRGAPRLRPFAELEFRGRFPTDAVQRRVGCRHAYLGRRLHRHVQGAGRGGLGRPAGGHPRGSQQEPGRDRGPGGPVLRPRRRT